MAFENMKIVVCCDRYMYIDRESDGEKWKVERKLMYKWM